MSDTVHVHDGDRPEADARQLSKRPYEAPRLLFREPLEAVAAVCTPAPPGKGSPAQGCTIGSS